MPVPRIALVAMQPLFADIIRRMLGGAGRATIVDIPEMEQAVAQARALACDVLILAPGLTPAVLRAALPGVRVLAVTDGLDCLLGPGEGESRDLTAAALLAAVGLGG